MEQKAKRIGKLNIIDLIAIVLIVAVLAGGLAAGLAGVLVGIPALRLRGDYLAIVTMAFAEIIRVVFCNLEITAIPGHFVTSHSHINYYIDITMMKHDFVMAREAAVTLAQH